MRIKIKPAPGLKIRDPDSKIHLPQEGAEVTESSFWIRRLRSGDVVLVPSAVVTPVKNLK